MASRTGPSQAEQTALALEVNQLNTDANEKNNKAGVFVEGYVDSGCKTMVFIPKLVLKTFGPFKGHVANQIPSYIPKSTKTTTTTRPNKFKTGGLIGNQSVYVGKLWMLEVAGEGVDKLMPKPGGGSSTRKVKNLYMRFPSIMDSAAVSFFILNGFSVIPERWKLYRGKYVTKSAEVDLASLGTKYSSKMKPVS